MTTDQIIEENEKRLQELNAPYDPITGEGSLIDRFPFFIYKDQEEPFYLPQAMIEEYGSIDSLEASAGQKFKAELLRFQAYRLENDFEFWAIVCAKIKNKEGGALIPFKLRLAQRMLLQDLIEMFNRRVPIRIILVKARQWGGSTLVQIFMIWIQLFHKTNWNSVIVGDIEEQARNVRAMYTRLIRNYPSMYGSYTLSAFENSTKNRIIEQRENVVSIGSMQKPDGLRSSDISMAHLTEVAFWKKTEGKSPEDLIQNILGTIPDAPYSLLAMESTAKGVGNFFHRQWQSSVKGETNLRPVFIPWYKIDMYVSGFDSPEEKRKFIENMTPSDKILWDYGATIEGIRWYNNRLSAYAGDTWRMQSEFPSTPEDAFQSTGHKVYPPNYIITLKDNLRKPILVGDILGKERSGSKEAFKDLRIVENPHGNLSVWAMPNDPPLGENEILKGGRYALFVDIGGRSKDADYSVISGFDRYYMAKGLTPERAFTWRGHIDQDLLAWKAAQLAWIYDRALLAFEVNSLKNKNEDTEGEHSFTILDELSGFYDRLYARTKPEDIRKGLPAKWGFHTNSQTKGMLVDNYNRLLRLNSEAGAGYVEYDENAYYEADFFEYKEDGSMGAVEGQHDDIHISTIGGLWLCTSYMQAPSIIKKSEVQKRPQIVKSAANF